MKLLTILIIGMVFSVDVMGSAKDRLTFPLIESVSAQHESIDVTSRSITILVNQSDNLLYQSVRSIESGAASSLSPREMEVVIASFCTHFMGKEPSANTLKAFETITLYGQKMGTIPGYHVQSFVRIAKNIRRVSKLDQIADAAWDRAMDLQVTQLKEMPMMMMGLLPTETISKSVANLYETGNELAEVVNLMQEIAGYSKPGTPVMISDVNFDPFVDFIKNVEILKLLEALPSLQNTSNITLLKETLLKNIMVDYYGMSRQIAGLEMAMGGKAMAMNLVAIIAYTTMDLKPATVERINSHLNNAKEGFWAQTFSGPEVAELELLMEKTRIARRETVKIEKLAQKSGTFTTVGHIAIGLLQNEFKNVDDALSFIAETDKYMEKLGIENPALRRTTGFLSDSAKLLRKVGDTGADWSITALQYPQMFSNWTAYMTVEAATQIATKSRQVASGVATVASKTGEGIGSGVSTVQDGAKSLTTSIKSGLGSCKNLTHKLPW